MVPGLVWALFIRKRDQPHRTHDWNVSSAARRRLVLQLLLLPRVEALPQHARRLQRLRRLPCREDSVISSTLAGSVKRSLLPYSIFSFSFLLPQTLASAMVWWLRRLRAAGLFHPLAVEIFLKSKNDSWTIAQPSPIPNLSPTVCGRNPTACVPECPENFGGRPCGGFRNRSNPETPRFSWTFRLLALS